MPFSTYSTRSTPQSRPIPGRDMVPNSAGGFSFALDDWKRFERFLILGSEGGTYYVAEHALTRENAAVAERCIRADGPRAVAMIASISVAGRAVKNDPALFALALAAALGDERTRALAFRELTSVARTGTHLFHFLDYAQGLRGWGRGLRRAVARWYTWKVADELAYQVVKYQQRDGWSHRDALALAHPKSEALNPIFRWVMTGELAGAPDLLCAFDAARRVGSETELLQILAACHLPWEAIPTEWLKSAAVWQALLPSLPMTALLRNLGRMTAAGALLPGSEESSAVVSRLYDGAAIRHARLHPLAILGALKVYGQGHGERGHLSWTPVHEIADALEKAFYLAFQYVEPTRKRIMLALDVSGSMAAGEIAGMPGITPRIGSAAMAMVTRAVEENTLVTIFSNGRYTNYSVSRQTGLEGGIIPFDLRKTDRLESVIARLSDLPFNGTDCALPMLYAAQHRLPIDVFVVYTDSETWHGGIHPAQALKRYRELMGIPAKMVVVGMTSNGFSIADPDDAGMLDVVGFDTATPALISNFAMAE